MELNLTAKILREYCESLGIQLCFASVKHPQSNGAVERANGIICTGISKCLVGLPKGKWVDELPKVVWVHNTTVPRSTNFSPSNYFMEKKR
jgi:transposase InsO family protein